MFVKRLLLFLPLILFLLLVQSYFWVPTYENQAAGNPDRLVTYIEGSSGDAKILNPILNADSSGPRRSRPKSYHTAFPPRHRRGESGCEFMAERVLGRVEQSSSSSGESKDRRSSVVGVRCAATPARVFDAIDQLACAADRDRQRLGDVGNSAVRDAVHDLHRLEPRQRQVVIAAEPVVDEIPELGLQPHQIAEQSRELYG